MRHGTALGLVKLMRPREWVKNVFVVAPVFFGAELTNSSIYTPVAAAVLCFCFASSGVYVLNDLCDVKADRQHEKKRLRPLASGAVSSKTAMLLCAALVAIASGIPAVVGLPPVFFLLLGGYFLINAAYSFGLKHVAVLELFLVSSGFVLRLLAGGVASRIVLSPWIIVATAMISLLLATGKRRGDLTQGNDPTLQRRSLEGYNVPYLDAILAAIAWGTLIVFILFCVSDYATQRYGPLVLLASVPVAAGVLRFVQVVVVRNGGDSPTDLLLKDPFIISTIAIFILIFAALLYA